ncbi:MAG: Rcs stress response system protein RcsF [Gammaproteobacteria bacterium]
MLKIGHLANCTLAAAVLLLFGCATNPDVGSLSSSQRAKVASMDVLRGPTSRPYTILGTVKGLSCHRNAYQRQLLTEAEAIEGIKLQAALLEAEAVINTVCQMNSGTDWINNCWSSIVCAGDAVRYK